MGERRRARIFALQTLFQYEITRENEDVILSAFWSSRQIKEETRAFTEKLVRGVISNMVDIDAKIAGTSKRWKVDRLAVVDRNIIRLAIYEAEAEGTPKSIVINEAIEISRLYSSENAASFINGILDKAMKKNNEN